ncbi:hypothetical protein JCM33374_g1161 [Metschnikowia sp. JCM 33374]|nr:hypothetical protein JCM33374_g1161 [Metschnikowia sp. JCM 33374]
MSTSPCCAEYKFPASSPKDQGETSNYGMASAGFAPSKPPKEGDDYFALKAPSTHSQRPTFISPKKQLGRNQACGSMSSLGSETTFIENSSSLINHDFNMSTDTLFEDCELNSTPAGTSMDISTPPVSIPAPSATVSGHVPNSQRNVLQLSLSMPKKGFHHKARSSIGSTTGSLARQAIIRDREISEDTSSLSAVESRFKLDRKYSLGVAEDALSRERDEQDIPRIPTLKKQLTLPILTPTTEGTFLDTIKSQQMKRLSFIPPQESFHDSIINLSPTIRYISPDEIVSVINQSNVHSETGLRDVLILDIRPLADHVKSHIAGSINICLPSTLLKRPSFDFKRCVNSLPAYEKMILQNYFYHNNINFERQIVTSNIHSGAHGFPAIILYDHSSTSSNIYHMCRKLIDHSCFDASSAPPIYLIDAPFQTLAQLHPTVLECGKVENVDVGKLTINQPLDESRLVESVAPGQNLPSRPLTPSSLNALNPIISGLPTPNVSNFSLPRDLPETKFKIRHNEEMFDFSTAPSSDDKLSTLTVTSPGLRLLPQWLQSSVSNNTQIRSNFNKLEECEKTRLNSALKLRVDQEFMTPGGRKESTPIINSGLDYGLKNRYKDIFLYEHSRVSLNDSSLGKQRAINGELASSGGDYINASYLRSSKKVFEDILGSNTIDERLLRYSNSIATQGPLSSTAGDFWKCVASQGSLVIISLTNDVENGVEKCFAFWKSGTYVSGDSHVEVILLDTERFGSLHLRTFAITIDHKFHHKVMQIHLDSWLDMGVAVDSEEVLAMIYLKNHILSNTPCLPEYPTVIHCSAGCGRTGVFAAADMLMNAFRFKGNNFDVVTDPVYDVVNDLRRQRISMVQTIRQYGSIYSLLIHNIVGSNEWQSISDTRVARSFLGRQ